MIALVLFLILLVLVVLAAFICGINLVVLLLQRRRQKDCAKRKKRCARWGAVALSSFVLGVVVVAVSQFAASTPALVGEDGKPIEGSISELTEVNLNGRSQWISIRGEDSTKPVLLFLAGGPGGSQMAAVRHELSSLEQDFVVVNWDQPGAGKSYGALPLGTLNPQMYIEDGIALTEYLCERFGQDSIYIVGESWGSALGVFMASERPELYHAFIGTGQMVDFLQTEQIDYALALQLAEEEGYQSLVSTLRANGVPPYYGSDVTWKSAAYLNYLGNRMARNPEVFSAGYNTFRDLASEEYGILDKVNYLRGIIDTFNQVYPQLYDVDLRECYTQLEVPTYFLIGEHDINAPVSLVEDYFEALEAPAKEIVWFEHSGHSPWINESDKFVQTVRVIASDAEAGTKVPAEI